MIDYRHLAGMIDARQGSLTETFQGYLQISIRLSRSKANHEFLKVLQARFGGSLFGHQKSHWYKVVGSGAEELLLNVRPYIVLKEKLATKLLAEMDKKAAKIGG